MLGRPPSDRELVAREPSYRRRSKIQATLGLVVLLGVACDDDVFCTPVLETEGGEVELLDAAMVHGACRRLREPAPLLAGTRWCPVLSCDEDRAGCQRDDEGSELDPGDVAACFEHQVVGATWDEGCLLVGAEGSLAWDFEPVACPANALGYQPAADSLVLPVVEAAEVVGWLDSPGDAFARRSLVGSDEEPFDESLQLRPGGVAHVLGGEPIELAAVLTHPERGNVGWNPAEWTIRAEVDGAEREVEFDALGLVRLTVGAGERMRLWLDRGLDRGLDREEVTIGLGEVEGVASSALTRLEVVSSFTGGDDDQGIPFGARAVLWAGDRVVYGVPVDWTVTEGLLPLWRDTTRPWGPDYIALVDEQGRLCHAPPQRKARTYRARLRATHGELEDEITMTWTEQPEDRGSLGQEALEALGGDDFERSPLCEGPGFAVQGCGCREGRAGGGGAAVLLLLLGWRRRSRAPLAG